MKKLFSLVITNLIMFMSVNAAWVCYGDNSHCFHSNGSCESTFSQCGGLGTSSGCSCDPNALMPPYPPSVDNDYNMIEVEDLLIVKDNTINILTINSSLMNIEGYNTAMQYTVNEDLKLVIFSIYDANILNELSSQGEKMDIEEAFIKTIKVAFD